MADRFVDPGNNTIQAVVNACAKSGDRIILRNGLYTFTGQSAAFILDSGFVGGGAFTNLEITSQNEKGAILDFTGISSDAIYGGDAQQVKINNMVWQGNPTGQFLRDHANSSYTGWNFDEIDVDATTKTPFLITVALGIGLRITNITSRANFAAARVIELWGPASNIDLFIAYIDGRLHTAPGGVTTMNTCVKLRDVRDARVRYVEAYDCLVHGLEFMHVDPAKGQRDIFAQHLHVVKTGGVGMHVGNTALIGNPGEVYTTRVYVDDYHSEDTAAYGFEFENRVAQCSLTNYHIERATTIGVPFAEDTEDIVVAHGVIDGVASSGAGTGAGTAMVNAQDHRFFDNVVANCVYGVQLASSGGFTIPNERDVIKENKFYNCDYIYKFYTAAFPTNQAANRVGPNAFTAPKIAYALVNDAPQTQAQFSALASMSPSIDEPDVLLKTGDELLQYKFGGKLAQLRTSHYGSLCEKLAAAFEALYPRKPRSIKILMERFLSLLR